MSTTSRRRLATVFLFSVAVLLTGVARSVCGQSPLDSGFKANTDGPVDIVVIQPDAKILVGGHFRMLFSSGSSSFIERNNIARWKADGSVDKDFKPPVSQSGRVSSIALRGNDIIWIGGNFALTGLIARKFLAQLTPAQGVPNPFNAQLLGHNVLVRSIVVQAHDKKVLVGGSFTSILGQPRKNIARLNPNGTLDLEFNPLVSGSVHTIAVQPHDQKILVGGLFGELNGVQRHSIGRLNKDGTLDTGFAPNAHGDVRSIVVHSNDHRILVGGRFTSIGGDERSNIAQLDSGSGLADSFNPKASGSVNSVAVHLDQILVGGEFTSIGGKPRNRIARLKPNGQVDPTFDPNVSGVSVNTIAVQPDGKRMVIGGNFESVAGESRKHIARILLVPQPTPTPTPTPTPSPSPTPVLVKVTLPTANLSTSIPPTNVVIQPVTAAAITPTFDQDQNCLTDCYISFQGEFTFDSAVIGFANPRVEEAELTAGKMGVSTTIFNTGPGTIKTLRVFAFSSGDGTPLNGSGTLFNLRINRLGNTIGATSPLVWKPAPDNFFFTDINLNTIVTDQTNGVITITGP